MADPEVALTELERKRMFDMAMELHELQRRGTEAANALRPFGSRMAELAKEIGGRADVPAEVKASFDALNKEVAALAPRLTPPAGGGGAGGPGGGGGFGGGGGANPNVLTRLGQAKNSLMGGLWPTEQTLRAYNEAKTQVPTAMAEANALFTKAAPLASALAAYKLTLTVPAPLK